MKRAGRIVAGVLVLTIPLLVTGCEPIWTAVSSVSFAAGWVARGLALPTSPEPTCYRNGVLIDCAEVPADLQPTS
jgi:hypothetical protein